MSDPLLVVDAKKGLVAIYEGPENAAIEDDPFTDLSKVTFHSDLDYVGFTKVTLQHTIAGLSQNSRRNVRIALQPHSLGLTPVVFAILRGWTNGDGNPVDLPLCGGLLLDFYGQRPGDNGLFEYQDPSNSQFDKWSEGWRRRTDYNNAWDQKAWTMGAGADDTNLLLWYDQSVWNDAGAFYPETTVTIDFYVGDRSVDGQVAQAPTALADIGGEETLLSASNIAVPGRVPVSGKKYYARKDDVNPNWFVATNPTSVFSFSDNNRQFGFAQAPHWRWNIRPYSFGNSSFQPLPDPGFVGLKF